MKLYDSIVIINLLCVFFMLVTISINNVLNVRNKKSLLIFYSTLAIVVICEYLHTLLCGKTTDKTIFLIKTLKFVELSIWI